MKRHLKFIIYFITISNAYSQSSYRFSGNDLGGMGANTCGGNLSMPNLQGKYNTALGYNTLNGNQSGTYNTAVGVNPLTVNTTGNYNTALGVNGLFSNKGGNNNIAIGINGMYKNQNASSNIAIGNNTLYNFSSDVNSVGYGFNIAIGDSALYENSTGIGLIAIGYGALKNITSDFVGGGQEYPDIALGNGALYFNKTGGANIAIGTNSLANHQSAVYSVAIGAASLMNLTNGYSNIAIGRASMGEFKQGSENIGIGEKTLLFSSGDKNVAIGNLSQYGGFDAYSYNNTSIGYYSLRRVNGGMNNTAIGSNVLFSNTSGSNNTVIGDSALYNNINGNNNVSIGYHAGFYETGNNKLYIAADSDRTIIYGDMSTGQVLLGKKQPNGYAFKGTRTLNVIGGVLADSMRVALSGKWADYVFEESYKLRNLDELEEYIIENKHLPNIPSSQEVSQNGIDLASMNAKLLEKIEELHLYILKLKKDNIEINDKYKSINESNIELEKRIIALEKRK